MPIPSGYAFGATARDEVVEHAAEHLFGVLVDFLLVADEFQRIAAFTLQEVLELLLRRAGLLRRERVEVPVDGREDDGRLHLERERHALRCVRTSVMRRPESSCFFVSSSRSEENCMKASSSRNCASVSLILPETFFMAFVCAEEPTRETEMPTSDGRAQALIEEVGLEVDLAVGDGDDVRRDVRGDVAFLGLDDRKGRKRAASLFLGKLRRALEEAGNAGRRCRPDTLRGLADGARRRDIGGMPLPAWKGRRTRRARSCPGP